MGMRLVQALARAGRAAMLGLALAAAAACALPAWAGTAASGSSATDWPHLSPAQRQALAPLAGEWPRFGADRRRKWLNIAARYPAMSPEQQKILQQRMTEWVHMTPQQRSQARANFLATGKAPLQSRKQAWEQYQKLPAATRHELAHETRPVLQHPHVGQYGTRKHRKPAVAGPAPKAPPVGASQAAAPAAQTAMPPTPVASGAQP